MSSPLFRRAAAVLVLGLTLLSPWAAAAQPHDRTAHHSGHSAVQVEQGVWGKVWWVLTSLWSKNGMSIDPNGLLSGQPTADAGCSPDPNGRCSNSANTADNGCSPDPDGRCSRSATMADNGCSPDPNGRCTSGH